MRGEDKYRIQSAGYFWEGSETEVDEGEKYQGA